MAISAMTFPSTEQLEDGVMAGGTTKLGHLVAVLATALVLSVSPVAACSPVDFTSMAIVERTRAPVLDALLMAYRDIEISADGTKLSLDGRHWIDVGEIRSVTPNEVLRSATVSEQFLYHYPLNFDLSRRKEPFFDPGRPRNDAFFKALYFDSEDRTRETLVKVPAPGLSEATFWVTRKWGVDCQLRMALQVLAESDEDFSRFFKSPGGAFNWRRISGTSRLSPHSFGIAVDINAELGQYWKWTGANEGDVGAYDNKVPEALVSTMERFGFIWGGKWHHFDGMHFEYRPELILYSRMVLQ
ncbi:M15 family metallopeptidase [Tropicimonas sp. IMCC6043]|uniref:M15 family metallopeptidase n=1 Tax=Tropicimonas sp. IMCC6043 TaxID=2510645 RepID=UPI0013EC3E4E|nr:M15 family metallopeptidase [Tropicimonas sp. IMCC6043]